MILSRLCGTGILPVFRLTIAIAILMFAIAPFNTAIAAPICPDGMAFIPKGTFTIGSDIYDAAEASASDVTVESFCIDRHEITNAEFRQFVEATDYQTVAERPVPQDQFPDLSEEERQPGSLVFWPPESLQQMSYLSWWHWVVGANWQNPYGPESTLEGLSDYPAVHIAYEDAVAYANWVGKSLPTEAQWEYAARGGLDGDAIVPREQYTPTKANTWQGIFPFFNTKEDGYLGLAPIQSFESNGYGLYDMLGNVWELTTDWYRAGHPDKEGSLNPTGPDRASSFDPRKPNDGALRVIKGGSFLCARNYCSRYRPEARESQALDTGTNHIGFRLVKNL